MNDDLILILYDDESNNTVSSFSILKEPSDICHKPSPSQLPGKRLPQHRLRQPLAPPARRHHAHSQPHARKCVDMADDLLMFGKGREAPGWAGLCRNERKGCFLHSGFQGQLHEVRIGCRNLAKGAMRRFWKIANRAFVACAGKIFWGKFGEVNFVFIVIEEFYRACYESLGS